VSEEHLVYFVYETLSKPHTSFLIEALFHSAIISWIINFNINFNIAVLKSFVFKYFYHILCSRSVENCKFGPVKQACHPVRSSTSLMQAKHL